MPDEELPDPADVARYLNAQTGTEHHRRMCRIAARYILAGLELALLEHRRRTRDRQAS